MSEEKPEDKPVEVLNAPRAGLPRVTDTQERWADTVAALSAGAGPVAVDAERAQGFRYSAKAYLFQFRRAGAGTHLVDPVALQDGAPLADLSALSTALGDAQWIIHAASQDLPSLVETGLHPTRLFDTELAGRLLGLPRVALGSMIEQYFGLHLMKEHSAADWSIRPIPPDWLNYAALDVELLIELRDVMAEQLVDAGKDEWARQEFVYLLECAGRHQERPDRWRRTSGTHSVRTPQGLAVVRELWSIRDHIAQELDKAPGKVLPDAAITELASLVTRDHPQVPTRAELRMVHGFKRREARRHEAAWLKALDHVRGLSAPELPPMRVQGSGLPAPRNWEKVKPEAWARWNLVRPATVSLAEQLNLPVENLIAPEQTRQLAWQPAEELSEEAIDAQLAAGEVRPWQRELLVPDLVALLRQAENEAN